MPSPSVKKLYLASSIEELSKKIVLDAAASNSSSNMLIKAVAKVHKTAEDCYLRKDEEKAYVMYMKFIDLFLLLRKRKDFNEVIKNFRQLETYLNPAIDRATELKKSLRKRYGVIKEAIDKEKEINISTVELHEKPENCTNNETNEVLSPLESNAIISEKLVPKGAISSEELYCILSNHTSSVVMMDVRSQKDYNESHVKHSYCINIPSEILKKGIIGAVLQNKLPPESLQKWHERSKVDMVVLLDWEASIPVDSESPLSVLQDAMWKWELKNKLKNPPLILKGGYKDWMLKYPMYTTQVIPLSALENSSSEISLADFSDVQYPNFDEAFMESPKAPIVNPDSGEMENPQNADNFPQTKVNGWISDNTLHLKTNKSVSAPPCVDRRSKPKAEPNDFIKPSPSDVNASQSQSFLINKPEKNINIGKSLSDPVQDQKTLETVVSVPTVNRRLKPLNVASKPETKLSDVSLATKKDISDSGEELNNVTDSNEWEILEKQLEHLVANIDNATDESKVDIQKKIDTLSILIKRAKIGNEEIDKKTLITEIEKVKEVSERHKTADDEGIQPSVSSVEFKKMQNLPKTEKFPEDEVDKLEEKSRAGEKKSEIPMSPKVDRPLLNDTEVRNEPKNQARRCTGMEYTLSLSKDGTKETFGRGLTRSHSFPNIAQMVEQEESPSQFKNAPTVDRTLKPRDHTPFIPVEYSTVRQRNFRPVYGCQGRPITGIKNLGNTCFMNSIIQCLSNALPFAQYFTSGDYRQHLNRNSQHGTKGEVAEEFAAVIQALWNGQYRSISPFDFMNTVSRYLPICNGHEQQDSHEFLIVLMDKLHGDLKQKCEVKPMPNLDSLPDNLAKGTFWDFHKGQNRSKISALFDGLLKSTLRCLSCSKTSHSYEVFSCLSVPISTSKCSLKDCIDSFLKSERMSGEGAWDCPKCKQKKEAEKRMVVCELPDILVVQLKRFSYEGLWRRKLQTYVDFPYKFEMPYEVNGYSKSKYYSLYGVVNHIGTLEGGHYTAYCKNYNSGKWYKYDDHEVTETGSSSIKTSEAYLLFYLSSDYESLIK